MITSWNDSIILSQESWHLMFAEATQLICWRRTAIWKVFFLSALSHLTELKMSYDMHTVKWWNNVTCNREHWGEGGHFTNILEGGSSMWWKNGPNRIKGFVIMGGQKNLITMRNRHKKWRRKLVHNALKLCQMSIFAYFV